MLPLRERLAVRPARLGEVSWIAHHQVLAEFWHLMILGCWIVFPCLAVPL